ncbi:MAG: T9SS type A sorting domain-containing protein [Bacteroidetes bacterium]|nr:T9SS type A sorting domain-containing protein [Bacteroidota bacterium]
MISTMRQAFTVCCNSASWIKVFTFFFLCFSFSLKAQIFVKPGGVGDGTSWQKAFGDLNQALSGAMHGDELWVAMGTYYTTQCSSCTEIDKNISFEIPEGVAVYGGFSGVETYLEQRDWKSRTTILSGDIDKDGSLFNNAYTVVFTANVSFGTILDGFTIRMGNAASTEGVFENRSRSGGGWFNYSHSKMSSNPTIRNCTFTKNHAMGFGGAVFNYGPYEGNSSPKIENCTFSVNKAEYDGGAVYNNGGLGGKSNPSFSNCRFSDNQAGIFHLGSGGAVFNSGIEGECSPSFVNCEFSGQKANLHGGAVYNHGKKGISNPSFINCLFNDNLAELGGAVYNFGAKEGFSAPAFTNCTFYYNRATDQGAVMYNFGYFEGVCKPVLKNCILWENDAPKGKLFANVGANPILSHTLVQGIDCDALLSSEDAASSVNCGEGMLYGKDPKFISPNNGNLKLNYNSPAIDIGDRDVVGDIALDLDNNSRIALQNIDLGAYEYNGSAPLRFGDVGASSKIDHIQLTWETQTEYNTAGFQVERSLDGSEYKTIDYVPSKGDSEILRNYEYDDFTPKKGIIYHYRLKSLDFDGCFLYSSVDTAFIEVRDIAISLYPNPAIEQVNVSLFLPEAGKILISVIDFSGKKIQRATSEVSAGFHLFPFHTENLPAGTYAIVLEIGEQNYSLPFVLSGK